MKFLLASAAPLFVGGCVNYGTPVATYEWHFRQIRGDAIPQEKAFNSCEPAAKKRNKFIGYTLYQIYSYSDDVISCMTNEGWLITKQPYTIKNVY
jgi:hypothetical protein